MDNEVKVVSGSTVMTWDPVSRLAVVRFTELTTGAGKDAEALVSALSEWIGADGEPFGLLGDGASLRGVDPNFRSVWGSFLRQHRQECFVAFFNMGPLVRTAAEMFRIGTGLRLKACIAEEDARSWLREMGIAA